MAIRRLFFDLETSPNIGLFWKCGYKLNIPHENIVKERGIICCSWKWEGERKVHTITWTQREQDDRRVCVKVASLIAEADEVVAHNGDRFDIPWLRGRCLFHGISMPPRLVSQDTCILARRLLGLNANRLDYLGSYLKLGRKIDTGGFSLWKRVLLDHSRKAMGEMVRYCEQDVRLLEKVWKKLMPYVPAKSHVTGLVRNCPECGSSAMKISKTRTLASGSKKIQLLCNDCGKYHSIAASKMK